MSATETWTVLDLLRWTTAHFGRYMRPFAPPNWIVPPSAMATKSLAPQPA